MEKLIARKLKRKRRVSRRRFLKGVSLGTLGFCTACAIDAWGIEPEWLEVVELNLPVSGLGKSFIGKKIISTLFKSI